MTQTKYTKQPLAYIRVSSDQQVEHGFSIQTQKDSILNFCKLYSIPEPLFITDEGLSARTTKKRKGILEIIQKVKDKETELVIAYNFSRMFRNVVDTLNFVELLEKNQVEFMSVCEKIDTSTAFGKLNITILAAFNRMMSDKISEDTRITLKNKKLKGEVYTKSITGFQNHEGKLIPVPQELEKVKTIFKLAETKSPYHVAKILNEQNISTKHGNIFTPAAIKKVIKNREFYLPHMN